MFITVLPQGCVNSPVFCHHVAEGPEPSGQTSHSREVHCVSDHVICQKEQAVASVLEASGRRLSCAGLRGPPHQYPFRVSVVYSMLERPL